jgi:hypothetical protein
MALSTTISYVGLIIALIIILVMFILFLVTISNARKKYIVAGYSNSSRQKGIWGTIIAGLFVTFLIIFGACFSIRH